MMMEPQSPKKQPYTGDPNATMTICVKKLRRHLPRDIDYALIPTDKVNDQGQPLTAVAPICRHCKQSPMTPEEVNDQAPSA